MEVACLSIGAEVYDIGFRRQDRRHTRVSVTSCFCSNMASWLYILGADTRIRDGMITVAACLTAQQTMFRSLPGRLLDQNKSPRHECKSNELDLFGYNPQLSPCISMMRRYCGRWSQLHLYLKYEGGIRLFSRWQRES